MNNGNQLWTKVHLITLTNNGEAYGLIENGAIVSKAGRIAWLGKQKDIPNWHYDETVEFDGRYLTPGLIDCHTHHIYAGDRADEFEMLLNGIDYREIAKRGGGILSTVKKTREASKQELIESATKRLDHFIKEGVTTVEIKSGYGLDTDSELKILRVIQELKNQTALNIESTFLGAHAIPPEFENNADAYIDLVCYEMLPKVAKAQLATAVDAFCETIAFSYEQTERVFASAKAKKLNIKLHADQLSDSNSAALAARFHALSADHLEYTSENSVKAMAQSGTVAVLLPGAFYTLGETQLPPIHLFRKYKVPMAVASDSNPGSSPVLSLQLMLNMACNLFKLTPEEAIKGVTIYAALALGRQAEIGTLEVGKKADFAIWDINQPTELAYYAGGNPCYASVKDGQIINF